MRYSIGMQRVLFMVGSLPILSANIKTCPECGERFVVNSMGRGLKHLYGERIRELLLDKKIRLSVTSSCCEDCQEEHLAKKAALAQILVSLEE